MTSRKSHTTGTRRVHRLSRDRVYTCWVCEELHRHGRTWPTSTGPRWVCFKCVRHLQAPPLIAS